MSLFTDQTFFKMVKMLDLVGLPRNSNGFRTTHTCELCGFEPKTKNKYREKQDHLVMKHFKEKIDKIFPHCRPYSCPAQSCEFTGKDKQALLRHYTGKHGILEQFLREALSEKGINYAPGDHPKRKNSTDSKKSRASPGLTTAVVLPGPSQVTPAIVDPKDLLPSVPLSSASLMSTVATVTTTQKPPPTTKPNNEELRREVEAMMASFQPQPMSTASGVSEPYKTAQPPLVVSLPQMPTLNLVSGGSVAQNGLSNGSTGIANGIKLNQVIRNMPGNGGPVSITLPTIPIQSHAQQHSTQGVPKLTHPTALPMNPLPPMSLILPQEPARISTAEMGQPSTPVSKAPLPSLISNGRIIKTPSSVQLLRRSPPPMPAGVHDSMPDLMLPTSVHNGYHGNVQLPPLPSVLTIQQPNKMANKLGNMPPGGNPIPMPIESLNGPRNSVNSDQDSTPPSSIAMDDPMEMTAEQTAVVLENEEIMWSAPMDGPAVVVEVADTVPVTYITDNQNVTQQANGVITIPVAGTGGEAYTANTMDNMEYDYLYANGTSHDNGGVRERQLDFCML